MNRQTPPAGGASSGPVTIDYHRRRRGRHFEILRFVSVGLLTNGVYFAVLAACQFGAATRLAVGGAVAYAASAVFNYLAHRSYTFRSDAAHGQSLPRYAGVQAVGLAINSAVLEGGVQWLGLPFLAAQIVALGLVTAWTYIAQRQWVYAQRREVPPL